MTPKNILITGLPHSGKSTLLNKILTPVTYKQGFLTLEVREEALRTGFKIVTAQGTESLLASTSFESPLRVSKYGVNRENLEKIIPDINTFTKKDLLYLDEIGQMELFSDSFKNLVEKYLNSENTFIGTISQIYADDFTKAILARNDINIIELSIENRDEIYFKLKEILK